MSPQADDRLVFAHAAAPFADQVAVHLVDLLGKGGRRPLARRGRPGAGRSRSRSSRAGRSGSGSARVDPVQLQVGRPQVAQVLDLVRRHAPRPPANSSQSAALTGREGGVRHRLPACRRRQVVERLDRRPDGADELIGLAAHLLQAGHTPPRALANFLLAASHRLCHVTRPLLPLLGSFLALATALVAGLLLGFDPL